MTMERRSRGGLDEILSDNLYLYIYTNTMDPNHPMTITSTVYQSTSTIFQNPTPTGLAQTASPSYYPTNDEDDHGGLDHLPKGVKVGMSLAILLGIFMIVLFSIWFCCGGKSKYARKNAARNASMLPMHTVSSHPRPEPQSQPEPQPQPFRQPQLQPRGPVQMHGAAGEAPPPSYEEAVPPQHRTIAGGMPMRNEEEDGMVADGKTPLSEIPFEDIALEDIGLSQSSGASSSANSANSANQSFASRHHNQYGDTTGHTNS